MKKKLTPIEQVEKAERKKRQANNEEGNRTSRFSFAGNTGGPCRHINEDDDIDPQDNFYLTFGD